MLVMTVHVQPRINRKMERTMEQAVEQLWVDQYNVGTAVTVYV